MSDVMLSVSDVSKRFGKVQALDRVSLSLTPGERVALLGHNGAGKTTLFRAVLGFIACDGGAIRIDGAMPGATGARAAIAFLPENVAFPKVLTGFEVLALYARLKSARRDQIAGVLERVGLSDAANRRVGTYSKGMRQRLGLAQALIGAPRLLLLDEPTSGLDPLSRNDFYAILDEVSATGTAVLLSSHSLSEVEAKTDRVAILRQGRLVADASLARLQADAGLPIRIRVSATSTSVAEVSDRLGGERVNGTAVELVFPAQDKMRRLAAVSALGDLVRDVEISQPSLDDIYRHFSTDAEGDGK